MTLGVYRGDRWRRYAVVVLIDCRYDPEADIAWLRCEDYDPTTVVAKETDLGLREVDPVTKEIIGLEFWKRAANFREISFGCFRRRKFKWWPDCLSGDI